MSLGGWHALRYSEGRAWPTRRLPRPSEYLRACHPISATYFWAPPNLSGGAALGGRNNRPGMVNDAKCGSPLAMSHHRTRWPQAAVRGAIEGGVLLLVALSPWPLGSVELSCEFLLYVCIAFLLSLWGVRMLLEGQLSW